jgi:hypothetical protein
MTIRFAIEDKDHCQDISTHADLVEAIEALHVLAKVPWGQEPNVAPCITGMTCSRDYEIVEYDTSVMPWAPLRRYPGFYISSQGLVWAVEAPRDRA